MQCFEFHFILSLAATGNTFCLDTKSIQKVKACTISLRNF